MGVFRMSIVRYECLKDVFCTLWMFLRCLLCVMGVFKMSFVRYGCLKDVFCTLWMSLRCRLYMPFICHLKDPFYIKEKRQNDL